MKHSRLAGLVILFLLSTLSVARAAPAPVVVEDFALLDQHGRNHQLYSYADVPVVVIYSYTTGCPIARQDMAALDALQKKYKDKAVFGLLDPSLSDDRPTVVKEMTELKSNLVVLLDPAQLVAQKFNIDRTGEALVIRTKDWSLLWRGPVDDRLGYGAQKPQAKRSYLSEAIDAVLAGNPPSTDTPAAKGCKITFTQDGSPDYAKDVAPIVAAHCIDCHREGGIGPWSMTSYEQVKGHAAMIGEVIRTRRMPPWGADAPAGAFLHDNVITATDAAKLVRWIESGSPRGTSPDPLTAPLPPLSEWPLGKPDLIVECPPQQIPANGVLQYVNLQLATPIPADVWVRAVDVHPSDRRAMHHAVVFDIKPGEQMNDKNPRFNAMENYFAEYVPGAGPQVFPEGTGKLLAQGSHFFFQLHYTTNGVATVDHPRLGIYFAPKPPDRQLKVASAHSTNFQIPPGDRDFHLAASWNTPGPITLYGLAPHMHLRGSRMAFTAHLPDGSTQNLLSVPRYDFNWQSTYWLAKPISLPAGTKITCTGAFNNSRFNDANPDPTKTVHWGPQSFDEMFIGYVLYADR